MNALFAMIIVVFTPDGMYKDIVGMFPTAQACEKARAEVLAEAKKAVPDHFYFATCANPKAFSQVDA